MKITVFCGANNGRNEAYKGNAKELGKWIADNNHTLVYGGGKVGLMGIIADTVLENNSEVIGIMPQFLVDREISHTGITEFISNLEKLTKNELAAFGDGQNDIPMFETVGYSVVMGNAPDDVKKYADYVTKSNNEDGVAHAIENFMKNI